jgi:hypothetical protein
MLTRTSFNDAFIKKILVGIRQATDRSISVVRNRKGKIVLTIVRHTMGNGAYTFEVLYRGKNIASLINTAIVINPIVNRVFRNNLKKLIVDRIAWAIDVRQIKSLQKLGR